MCKSDVIGSDCQAPERLIFPAHSSRRERQSGISPGGYFGLLSSGTFPGFALSSFSAAKTRWTRYKGRVSLRRKSAPDTPQDADSDQLNAPEKQNRNMVLV